MPVDDALRAFENSLEFMVNKTKKPVTHLTVEYVGGEVSMIPIEHLKAIVEGVRVICRDKGIQSTDGVQTNLICSTKIIDEMYVLFEGRLGTSIDNHTGQRLLAGSSKKYQTKLKKSQLHLLEQFRYQVPAVITIDKNNAECITDEVSLAITDRREIVLRPIFQGGSAITAIDDSALTQALLSGFERWVLKTAVIIEPYYSLLMKRYQSLNPEATENEGYDECSSYCSWQHDCTKKSMSIEPNGDLFVCQELADHGFGRYGNALSQQYDEKTYDALSSRSELLPQSCFKCHYFNDCQGGCMMHSIESGRGVYGLTPYCNTWKALFKAMDDIIFEQPTKIAKWIQVLRQYNEKR
ncbi:SPASM domain-containing protein [Vibrio splendidus]